LLSVGAEGGIEQSRRKQRLLLEAVSHCRLLNYDRQGDALNK
jgi:hypothetical protein